MPNTEHSKKTSPDVEAVQKTLLPTRPAPQVKSAEGAPAASHAGTGTSQAEGSGNDAENANPAFPVFSPRPPVTNRALLPTGERQVVVDVSVNALGEVVSESLVKGIGNGLDKIVLDTVKTWRFLPATVNGKPVATEAELIFPFNPAYPIAAS
jgi:protein TonB